LVSGMQPQVQIFLARDGFIETWTWKFETINNTEYFSQLLNLARRSFLFFIYEVSSWKLVFYIDQNYIF
jgi:hypothetical protein